MAAVTSCSYDLDHSSATFDEHNLGTYEVGYIITTDGSLGPQSVANGALISSPHPLPSLWTTYSYQSDVDAYSWARDYKVTRDPKSRKLYYITVTYKPMTPGEGSQTQGEDPINSVADPVSRDPVMWWDREVTTQNILRDNTGKPVRNVVGHYYEDDIQIEKTKSVLVVEINVSTMAGVIAYSRKYEGAVNSSVWTIGGITIPARAALCREVSSGPPETEAGYVYFRIVFRIVFAENGQTWDEPMSESCQFHWSKTGSNYDMFAGFRKVTDATINVGLNDDGTRLAVDQPLVWTLWRVRREVNFSQLPF